MSTIKKKKADGKLHTCFENSIMSGENEDSYTGLAAVVLVTVTGMTHSELFVSEEKNCTRLLLETAVSQEL